MAMPRLFTDERLQAEAVRALEAVPPDKRGAIVAGLAMADGRAWASVRIAVRVDDGWDLVGIAEAPVTGSAKDMRAGVAVRGVW